MYNRHYYVVQDGDFVDPTIKELFASTLTPEDVTMNQDGERYDFVGFIFHNENTLISFPKHCFRARDLRRLSNNEPVLMKYVRLLFHCIRKTVNHRDEKYVGVRNEFNSDYPFLQFFEVYHYYKRYGLFTNEKEIKKFGFARRISWKDTINQSPKIINYNNLLFFPLVVREHVEQYVFISQCMAYVIDSTLEKFSLFLEGDKTNLNTNPIVFSNTSFVLSQLRKVRRTLFKDVHQRLVDTLISFFESNNRRGGNYQLKIHSFHLVWENMVKEFLRTKFSGINDHLEIVWDDAKTNNHFVKKTAYPDVRGKAGHRIELDYYLVSDNTRYLFDAKYYQNLKELDYKQIAYYFLLKHFEAKRDENGKIISELHTYNALMLPTAHESYSEVHFELNPEYNENEKNFIVMAYYLNTITIMEHYITA